MRVGVYVCVALMQFYVNDTEALLIHIIHMQKIISEKFHMILLHV